MQIRDLPGLGMTSEQRLGDIGIHDVDTLRELGALQAYMRLYQAEGRLPNRNFLYALVGALEGRSWLSVAKEDKLRLLMEIEAMQELMD